MRGNGLTGKLFFILMLLLTISLACSVGGSSEDIAPPEGNIPINQEATDRLKQNFNQAIQETSSSNEAQLRITNEEITSLVATELSRTDKIPLTNPQVWFTAGRIYITGDVSAFGVTNSSIIVATALVDNGRLVVEVQEAKMGPFDFPDSILESITQTVNETIAGILIDLDIVRLEILEGEMFVVGTRRTS
jgi:uncharacterized protein YpmS